MTACAAAEECILFLDDDPAVRLMRALTLRELPGELAEWLQAYLWPEILPEPAACLAALRAKAGWPEGVEGVHATPAVLSRAVAASVVAVVYRRGAIDMALLAALPRLRVIQRYGGTAPELDADAAGAIARRGIRVSVFPRRTLKAVAEHAIALLLAATRRLRELDHAARAGAVARPSQGPLGPVSYNWTRFCDVPLIHGSKAGIVGLGEVGAEVARLLAAFGAEVFYCNRNRLRESREAELGVAFLPLRDLLATVDSVVLSATPAPGGEALLGAAELALMRSSSVLVNVARGSLVDEAALIEALERHRIAGAGLDVFAHEPLAAGSALTRLPNVVLSPHVAGQTRLKLFDEIVDVMANVATALRGEAPRHCLAARLGG